MLKRLAKIFLGYEIFELEERAKLYKRFYENESVFNKLWVDTIHELTVDGTLTCEQHTKIYDLKKKKTTEYFNEKLGIESE